MLSIIIPILNEEKNIKKLNLLIYQNLKNFRFEIIFVDDNSIDNSKTTLNKICKDFKYTNYIIRNNNKRDLTQSCFNGIEKSKYKNILIMDGDLQHNPKYIKKMLEIFSREKLDIIIGARNFKKKNEEISFIRNTASIIIQKLISIFLGSKSLDPMSGFFIFKKEIYYKNKNRLFGKGYKILCDLLYSSSYDLLIKDYFIKLNSRNKGYSKMSFFILWNIIFFTFLYFIKRIFRMIYRK
jgi:dolichol-phosphate mannosyltransferase